MRKDVANLLAKLGKREFHYQEFADRFSDVELWPLFETLIHDPRILQASPEEGKAEASVTANAGPQAVAPVAVDAPAKPDPVAAPEEVAAAPSTPAPSSKDLSNLFARYGGQNSEDTPSDVHALLQKLAQQIEQGKL